MKDTEEKRYRDILAQHGIPNPPGETLFVLRYHMGRKDWYAETDAGWFWFDKGGRQWKLCPTGPMDF